MTNITLSEVVELYSERCGNPHLTVYDVSGVNRDKEFFEPSKQVGDDTSNYQVVPPHYFACNLMHVGRDMVLPISQNHTDKNKYVSPAYTVFRIKENDYLLDDYFFMILKSAEKDRFFWFHTDSSVRDGMSWEDFISITIPLPGIEVQREYVAVYKAMQHNLNAMQNKLDDLKLVCDAYIEQLRQQYPLHKIGKYITHNNKRNSDGSITKVLGLSTQKQFRVPNSRVNTDELSNYKIVSPNAFAFVPTTDTWKVLAFGLNDMGESIVVSPIYEVFSIKDEQVLCPAFLSIYLHRQEFDRYARYHSWGSARENFTWEDMCDVEIPIPPIEVQKSIVAIYDVYNRRKQYAERLRQMINEICPILVAASVGNTAVAAAHS